jgi:hypothetical protein
MKQLKSIVLLATILLFSSQIVLAAPSNLYWHSNDYYDIELNGIGNAFVVGTVSLEALTQQPVNTITLEIPYTGITVYKLVENGRYYLPPCQRCLCDVAGSNCVCPPCDQVYQPSSFLNYTMQTLSDSTILTINLAYPVQNDTATTLYLIFSTKSVAQKTFQGYQFDFKTVEDPNALIRSLSADVVVPQNMYLKGKPSFDIQYKPSELAAQALKSTNAESFVQSYPIRYGGGQFTANNLQPGESFTISGLYGDNLVLLYAQEIGLAVVGVIVLAILVKYYLVNKMRGMFAKRESEERIGSKRSSEFSFARAILTGFISSLIFIAVYYLLNIIFENGYYGGGIISGVTILVINAVFVILSIFGFPYYLYSQYSKGEGILAAIVSLVLSFLLLVLLLPQYSPPIIYAALSGAAKTFAGASTGTSTITPG